MVKKIVAACLCIALGSSLNAREMSQSEILLGLEVGYSEVQGERIGFLEDTGDDVMYGFRIGAQNDDWRTMFVFNLYDNTDTDQNIEQGFLAVEYFFLGNESSPEATVSPYIGAHVGYANYESTFVESDGMIYGGQIGFVVGVTEKLDIDFGYRYSLSDTDELDHVSSLVFGVNYLF